MYWVSLVFQKEHVREGIRKLTNFRLLQNTLFRDFHILITNSDDFWRDVLRLCDNKFPNLVCQYKKRMNKDIPTKNSFLATACGA